MRDKLLNYKIDTIRNIILGENKIEEREKEKAIFQKIGFGILKEIAIRLNLEEFTIKNQSWPSDIYYGDVILYSEGLYVYLSKSHYASGNVRLESPVFSYKYMRHIGDYSGLSQYMDWRDFKDHNKIIKKFKEAIDSKLLFNNIGKSGTSPAY